MEIQLMLVIWSFLRIDLALYIIGHIQHKFSISFCALCLRIASKDIYYV